MVVDALNQRLGWGSTFIDSRNWLGNTPTTSDRGPQLQKFLDFLRDEGPGATGVLPPWVSVTAQPIVLYNDVSVIGHGPGPSGIKLGDGSNHDVLTVAAYGTGGIHNFGLSGFHIDGNSAKNTEGSGLLLDGITFLLDNLYVFNCAKDGINEQKSIADGALRAYGEMDAFTQNVKVWDAGRYGIRWNGHDCHFTNVVAISNEVRNLLIDTEAFASKLLDVHAYGGAEYGMELKASAKCVNCEAEGGAKANVLLNADNVKWIGGEVFSDSGGAGQVGFEWAAGKGFNTLIEGVRTNACDEGHFKFTGTGGNSRVSGLCYGTKGTAVVGAPAESVEFDLKAVGGVALGVPSTSIRKVGVSHYEDGEILVVDSTKESGFRTRSQDGSSWYGASVVGTPASAVSPATNAYEYVGVNVSGVGRLHGITFRVGAANGGSVRVGLYNGSGVLVASSASTVLGPINEWQRIPFLATYVPEPGTYWLLIQYNGEATCTVFKARQLVPSGTVTGANFEAIPPSITPPTEPENVDRPVLMTY